MKSIFWKVMTNLRSGRTDHRLSNRWTLEVPSMYVWYKKSRRKWREQIFNMTTTMDSDYYAMNSSSSARDIS